MMEPMLPSLSHGPIDLSGTGTAYGQNISHNTRSKFDTQKGNVYSSGNIQTKHHTLMPSSLVIDTEIGDKHNKQLRSQTQLPQSPRLMKPGFSTQQVITTENYLKQPNEAAIDLGDQRLMSL